MKRIVTKAMALLALLTILSPTLRALQSKGLTLTEIEERTAALVAAIEQRTATLVEALKTLKSAHIKVFDDQEKALQNPHPKKTTTRNTLATASLTGKVFAITKGGDVKPALLAGVYFFPKGYAINEWMMSNIRARREYEATVKAILDKYPYDGDDSYYKGKVTENCRELLSNVDKNISSSRTIAPELFGPAYTTETDETGSFKIAPVKVGDYSVVVRGQAGSYDVLWIDQVSVAAGMNTLKLSSVVKACQPE